MDVEWIKDVICWAKQNWQGWLSLRWFWTKTPSTQTKSRMSYLPAEDEHHGCFCRGGRPAWLTSLGGLVPPLARFSSNMTIFPLWLSCPGAPQVASPKLSHPLLCLHYWSFHFMPFLWFMSMLLCFTCHHEFPTKQCLLPTHACPLHVVLMKVVGRASRDASWCMHDLLN
jgi:hypothetical protein